MTRPNLRSAVSLTALGAALAWSPTVFAADAAAPAANESLNEVVVTASGHDKTRIKSSISVTENTQQAIRDFTPHSEAEVLRLIPGIQTSGTAGPGGNANIGVRGIPVSTGGSEYVQLQEDGLPDVLFGDIQFGNNDYWLRFDNNVERVETVRGGSASTFASQGPGAIINYISKTGKEEGGEVGVSTGLGYRETRLDFDYGGRINDTMRFHIGGFFKDGSGPDHIGFTTEKGYQIKANVTKEFADDRGYLRFTFKRLDDQEPTNTSQPSLATISGNEITGFSPFAGIDARRYSSAGIYNQNFRILNMGGGLVTVPNEGIHPKATAFGGEFHYKFNENLTITDDFRYTIMSGAFANQWTTEGLTANVLGKTVVNAFGTGSADPRTATIGSIVYAAGPNQGQLYTGQFINNGAQVYTTMRDVGSFANNLVVNGKFDFSGDLKVNARAGVFFMRQNIAMDWRINNATTSLDSSADSAPLDLFSGPNGTGTQLSVNGQTGYNNQWGGCCGGRSYDLTYQDVAPFFEAEAIFHGLDLDGSVRIDSVKASGNAYAPVYTGLITVSDALGTASLPTYNTGNVVTDLLNYTKHYTSWSFGALYALNNNTSFFVRASRGGRFNADRLTYSGNFNADGSLDQHGNAVSLNFLNQQEIGAKNRGSLMGVKYNVEATFFRSTLTENNYDFTLLSRNPPQNPNISNNYRSYGLEVVAGVNYGNFHMNGFVTFTKPKLLNLNTVPHGQPEIQYLFSPSYDMGIAAIGMSINGQSSVWVDDANTLKVPASTLVNGFVKVRPFKGLELGVNVNNLFNSLAYPGGGYIQQQVTSTTGVFDSSAAYGRTFVGSVRYKF